MLFFKQTLDPFWREDLD